MNQSQCLSNVRSVIAETPELEFIVQRNDETEPLWQDLLRDPPATNNVSFLFDESKGTGICVEGAYLPAPVDTKVGCV
jgi:hypothetical protein